MSQIEINSFQRSIHTFEKQQENSEPNSAEQILNNEVFKMMLKDMIEELFEKRTKYQQQQQKQAEPKVSVENFIEEIGDSLIIIAQNQANKKIKEAEKFLNQMYEHKVKQIQDKFEAMIEDKLKEVDEKIKEIQERAKIDKNQSCFLSPVRPVLKSKQLIQSSFCEQVNKRMQLKQKLLNSSVLPEFSNQRSNIQIQSLTNITDCLNDQSQILPSVNMEKLTQKIRTIEQNFNKQMKQIIQKVTLIRSQCKTDLEQSEADVKQQLNSGFQGIWNVISNLEKRMMSLS